MALYISILDNNVRYYWYIERNLPYVPGILLNPARNRSFVKDSSTIAIEIVSKEGHLRAASIHFLLRKIQPAYLFTFSP